MKLFILDVDGVMTDGKFFYSKDGKAFKTFGADDADGLKLLSNFIDIRFVSADAKGFEISKKRITEDMGYKLDLVSSDERIDWISLHSDLNEVIYMGDGFNDYKIFNVVGHSICTPDSLEHVKSTAKFITQNTGGHRAVAQACVHILDKFYNHKVSQ